MIRADRLDLVPLPAEFFERLLDGDRAWGERHLRVPLPTDFYDSPDFLRWQLYRRWRVPGSEEWLARALIARGPQRRVVGDVGFHEPPSAAGMVEIGYGILATERGRGYAQEAARALISWAHRERGIRRFRAAVSPANPPSLAVVTKLGFLRTGTQVDPKDGEEIVHELVTENGLPWDPPRS